MAPEELELTIKRVNDKSVSMVPNLPQKMEKNVSHKVKRRALDATLSLVVDEDHELQDHINKTTSFEKNRRQRIYD